MSLLVSPAAMARVSDGDVMPTLRAGKGDTAILYGAANPTPERERVMVFTASNIAMMNINTLTGQKFLVIVRGLIEHIQT